MPTLSNSVTATDSGDRRDQRRAGRIQRSSPTKTAATKSNALQKKDKQEATAVAASEAELSHLVSALSAKGDEISYNRDIRPILSNHCFSCHGLDEGHRKAKLRLDVREEAIMSRDGIQAIVPGSIEDSESWMRIISDDEDDVMPVSYTHLTLPTIYSV